MAQIFISHSSADDLLARRIAADLRAFGHTVWLDAWHIRVGDCIPTQISRGLQSSRYVALLLSPRSCTSNWVDREWKTKYWEEVSRNEVIILPVLLETCKIPELLHTKKYADFRSDYGIGLRELLTALGTPRIDTIAGPQDPSSSGSDVTEHNHRISRAIVPELPALIASEFIQELDEAGRAAVTVLTSMQGSTEASRDDSVEVRSALLALESPSTSLFGFARASQHYHAALCYLALREPLAAHHAMKRALDDCALEFRVIDARRETPRYNSDERLSEDLRRSGNTGGLVIGYLIADLLGFAWEKIHDLFAAQSLEAKANAAAKAVQAAAEARAACGDRLLARIDNVCTRYLQNALETNRTEVHSLSNKVRIN